MAVLHTRGLHMTPGSGNLPDTIYTNTRLLCPSSMNNIPHAHTHTPPLYFTALGLVQTVQQSVKKYALGFRGGQLQAVPANHRNVKQNLVCCEA